MTCEGSEHLSLSSSPFFHSPLYPSLPFAPLTPLFTSLLPLTSHSSLSKSLSDIQRPFSSPFTASSPSISSPFLSTQHPSFPYPTLANASLIPHSLFLPFMSLPYHCNNAVNSFEIYSTEFHESNADLRNKSQDMGVVDKG